MHLGYRYPSHNFIKPAVQSVLCLMETSRAVEFDWDVLLVPAGDGVFVLVVLVVILWS